MIAAIVLMVGLALIALSRHRSVTPLQREILYTVMALGAVLMLFAALQSLRW